MAKLLVTGAGGFVGQALCSLLQERGIEFLPLVRRPSAANGGVIVDIGPDTDWRVCLAGVSVVIHLAARVHMLNDTSTDRLHAYRQANVDNTINLARQAAQSGVRRLVFLSTLKVNGESTARQAFRASDPPTPSDPYSISKWEAEQELRNIQKETGLEVVTVRPPLVYGPGVKANFLNLMRAVKRGIPMPLASVTANRRSMIFVGNLVDLILHCTGHPAAAGQTFLASDEHDVSTAALIQALAAAMGKRAPLFGMPPALLRAAASILGRSATIDRLLESLQVDIQFTKSTLSWEPPFSYEYGIDQTVRHFLASENQGRISSR